MSDGDTEQSEPYLTPPEAQLRVAGVPRGTLSDPQKAAANSATSN